MSSTEPNRTPRQVVDRIRTHSFLLDLDSESEMVKAGALNLQEQLNNALHLLSQDLYSKKAHFVLELVQNADDNHYKRGVTPHLAFRVAPKRLVVVNNEVGFNEANINAICSVGKSSKSKDKTGYIGEKGIGFKSVFTVSNAPEIHSNGFHFRFDRTDERNLLGYVVPHWCEPPAHVQSDCTTIILPAATNYEFSAETLVDLDARLLLFLHKLRQLTLEQNNEYVTYRRQDKHGVSHLIAERRTEEGNVVAEEMRYVRVSLEFPMKDQFADVKRPGIERSTVVLAFPVDETGAAKPEPASYLFAFLPVRQMGFRFPIQADFILNSSREEVLTDRPWNQLLKAAVPVVFSHAVTEFKKTDALGFTYLKYIPAEGEVADPFFRTVRKAIIDKLATTECLPSASGVWRKPSELRLAEMDFQALFPSSTAETLFGYDYVDPRVQGGSELLRSIGVKDVLLTDVLAVFKIHGDWLRTQALEWRAKFYAYVANHQEHLLKAGLLSCPCLPTSTGTMVAPAEASVFFPLSRAKRYGFEAELVLIDNDLYDEALKQSPRVSELFNALNVRPAEPYYLVTSHILPRHSGDAWKSSDFKALVGHLRYVKDKLKDYLLSAAASGKTEGQAFQLLREGIMIGTKRQEEGTWWFGRIGGLYLSKEYKPTFCLESLLANEISPQQFVSPDYLASKPKDAEAEVESWRAFLTQLGVRLSPGIEPKGTDWKCTKELQFLLSSPQSSVRAATLECMSLHWSTYSERMTYRLPSGRSYVEIETDLAKSLQATLAPTKKRMSVPLAEAYYPSAELKSLLGDGLPYVEATLSDAMLVACRITYQLDGKALIKRLRQLKEEGKGTSKQLQAIYRALDERLWDTEAAFIKQSFQAEALIHTRDAHKGWCKPSDVSWRSNGTFIDKLYPPIQSQYRDFNRFFIDRLGIPRELPTAKWVEALTQLEMVDDPDARKSEALTIYRRANRDLMPRFGREEVQLPEWIEIFETEAVYVNQRGEMVSNDEFLFANDAPELAALFDDDDDLSFLAIPPSEVPRLSRLLHAANVSHLSESTTLSVINSDSGVLDSDLTARVRRSVLAFARVLYSKRPESFEQALEEGRFVHLQELEVTEVERVELSVALGDYTRETLADIALSEKRVLYRTGARSVKDRLAAELCKLLGASLDLADTFARILMEGDPDSVEDFLRVRNVGGLPSDLLAALDRSGGTQAAEGEDEHADTGPDIDSDLEQESSPNERGDPSDSEMSQPNAPQGTPKTESATPASALSSDSLPPSGSSHGAGGTMKVSPSQVTGAPIVPSPSPKSPPPPTSGSSGIHTSESARGEPLPNSASTTGLEKSRGIAPSSPGLTTELPHDGDSVGTGTGTVALSPTLSYESPTGTPGRELSFKRTYGPSGRHRPKHGQSQPHRTKAGRLLSYAASPGEIDREAREDDPARAAAREATGRAAVEYFISTQAARWKSLTEMPHNNPGFDVHAIADDGEEEYIEVKGQSGAWTEEGVALTPTEVITAHQKGNRYWLCVVEYAHDDKRRQLHLVRNPFGLTQQFRFDVGWKSAAESVENVPLKPEKDMYIDMPGVGRGQIVSAKDKGRFFTLHVILEDGRQVNKPFNPAKMALSKEPTWQR